uniref:Uncharacterized protein n=1 Tax=Anguilla anguilla TaxID=7936 RepID=A0A0E9U486_ANGAN
MIMAPNDCFSEHNCFDIFETISHSKGNINNCGRRKATVCI